MLLNVFDNFFRSIPLQYRMILGIMGLIFSAYFFAKSIKHKEESTKQIGFYFVKLLFSIIIFVFAMLMLFY